MDSPRSAQPGSGRPSPGRRSRWVVVTVGASLVVVVMAVAALEIAPRPLAAALIRDWLGARGAPASITITALSDRGMTARLSVGDRRDPDLSIERMDVAYTALWWVPSGHRPTVAEAEERVATLRAHGPSPSAFTLAKPFPAPGGASVSRVTQTAPAG